VFWRVSVEKKGLGAILIATNDHISPPRGLISTSLVEPLISDSNILSRVGVLILTMLSSIGRAAIRRTGARAFTRTNPHSPSIWQLQRNSPSKWRDQLAARPLFYRGFATATKTATKAATTKPKKPAAKTTKKPAKRPAKKVAKKQVAKPKRKPTLKKPVKKRVTTEKAKIRLEKTKKTAESRAVKETALLTPSNSLPKPLPANAYMVYMAEKTRSSGIDEGAKATERLTELAHKWKEISPAELEVIKSPASLCTHSRFF
jgi:hypothetical protein